jgi:hypothetical protein
MMDEGEREFTFLYCQETAVIAEKIRDELRSHAMYMDMRKEKNQKPLRLHR